MPESSRKRRLFTTRLLSWRSTHFRNFPWRRTRNPYSNLIAEALLRKTTSKQVNAIYPNFVSKYPTPDDLLRAPLAELERELKPLGLYRVRARHLKKMAKILVSKHDSKVPRSQAGLLELPGISLYCSNAVLCFAYGEKVPLVDTNVSRVLQRVFGIKPKGKRVGARDPELWNLASQLIQTKKPREFNWAVLDFAAKVCTAVKPLCSRCPLTDLCVHVRGSRRSTSASDGG